MTPELERQIIAVFSKVGVAIRNGTKLELTAEEVKLLALTSLGDAAVTVSYDPSTYRLH